MKIKNIFLPALIAASLFSSCTEDDLLTGTDSSLANISLTNVNGSGKVVNFYIDTAKINASAIVGVNGTIPGTYAGVAARELQLWAKDTANSFTPAVYYSAPLNLTAGNSYSFFLYDTLVGGKFKGIILNTDRTQDTGYSTTKVRALNFSPKSPALDIWVVRRVSNGASPAAYIERDSVMISSATSYIGNLVSPDITALSAFKTVTASQNANTGAGTLATNYVVKAKLASTNTVAFSSPTGSAFTWLPSKHYTVMLRGIYPSLNVTVLQNN